MDLSWGLFFPPEDDDPTMIWSCLEIFWGFPGGSVAKNQCAMQELQDMQVQSLGWEDPLEESMEIHSSILAWRIPWTEEPSGLQSIGSQRVRHNWTNLACMHVKRYLWLSYQGDTTVFCEERPGMLLNLQWCSKQNHLVYNVNSTGVEKLSSRGRNKKAKNKN